MRREQTLVFTNKSELIQRPTPSQGHKLQGMNPRNVLTFSARIYKVGINPCVAVPARVSEAFNRRGYIRVRGTVNRFAIRSTLVPIRGGRHRLYINGTTRDGAHVVVGDHIHVRLNLNRARRRRVPSS